MINARLRKLVSRKNKTVEENQMDDEEREDVSEGLVSSQPNEELIKFGNNTPSKLLKTITEEPTPVKLLQESSLVLAEEETAITMQASTEQTHSNTACFIPEEIPPPDTGKF